MSDIPQRLRGTRDFYPEDMATRRAMYDAMDRVFQGYGYRQYDAPILEPFELYASKSSAEIVEKQSYVFEDRGERKIVVRPEMTPSLARLVASKQQELPAVLRWYTIANCWRYERPQKGRLRNFFQLNADLLGNDSVEADVEIISTGFELLRELGIDTSAVKVRLSDRNLIHNLLDGANVNPEQKTQIMNIMDRRDKFDDEPWREQLSEAGASNEAIASIVSFMDSVGTIPEGEAFDRIRSVYQGLVAAGYEQSIVFDPGIIRGLDYYTSTVFEFFDASGKFGRAIMGGGRYDKLIEAMGGAPMPAVGYAVSMVVLEELFAAHGVSLPTNGRKRVMVAAFSEEEAELASEIANRLRDKQLQVTQMLPPFKLKKTMKLADKLGVDELVLVSPDELAEGKVTVKNMETGEQQAVAIEDL